MRILYDHQIFSLQNTGGISRYFIELMKGLSGIRDVACEFFYGASSNAVDFQNARAVRQFKIPLADRFRPGRLRYALNETALSVAAPVLGKYDIYHSTHCRANRVVRRRHLVVTHHDCAYERFPDLFPSAGLVRKLRTEVFLRADAVICVSESTKRDLFEFYSVDPSKVHVIHHGITRFPSTVRHRDFCSGPYLLYVGTRASYKNFQYFLESFASSGLATEFKVLVLGGGVMTSSERTQIEELGIADKLVCEPWVSDDALAAAYEQAHLLVYPSRYEGFGFPPLEAMSRKCPVLVANSSSLPEVCGESAFYFDPREPEALSAALVNACFDDSERARKITSGTSTSSKFTWAVCVSKTADIYRGLCSE